MIELRCRAVSLSLLLAWLLVACGPPVGPQAKAVVPTLAPVVARPGERPADLAPLLDCDAHGSSDEVCLADGRVRLVGYLLRRAPDAGDFVWTGFTECREKT